MAEKTIKSRIQLKHDTTANWDNATSFIPKAGEPIVYTDSTLSNPNIKIGDGIKSVSELPFIDNKFSYEYKKEVAPYTESYFIIGKFRCSTQATVRVVVRGKYCSCDAVFTTFADSNNLIYCRGEQACISSNNYLIYFLVDNILTIYSRRDDLSNSLISIQAKGLIDQPTNLCTPISLEPDSAGNQKYSLAGNDNIPLFSPRLFGTPIAPTAKAGTNTDQIATTAFVQTATKSLVTLDTDQTIISSKTFNIQPEDSAGNTTSGIFDIIRNDISVFKVSETNNIARIDIDKGSDGDVSLYLRGNCGISGQVLTSQGKEMTPTWTTPVRDVEVNGVSGLNVATGVVSITIEDLKSGYLEILASDTTRWVQKTDSNNSVVYGLSFTSDCTNLGVFVNGKQIITQNDYDATAQTYTMWVGDKVTCVIRNLTGGEVTTTKSTSENSNDNVLIEVSNVAEYVDISTNSTSYNINVRLLSGTLQAGDRIQLCRSVTNYKYNIDKATGEKTNQRKIRKLRAFASIEIMEGDLIDSSKDIFTMNVPTDYADLYRSYTSSTTNLKVPLTLRIARPRQIGNNKEISYIQISNSVNLGTNCVTKVIRPI